jgi:hypothetical protein
MPENHAHIHHLGFASACHAQAGKFASAAHVGAKHLKRAFPDGGQGSNHSAGQSEICGVG